MPFVFRIGVTGAQTISRDLARLGDAGVAIARRVLEEKTRRMAELAKEYAPVEDGDLVNRIRATRPQAARDGMVTASVLAATSVIQHEDLTLHHTRGGPKFIERAVMLLAPDIPEALAAGIKRAAAE